uniref:Transcription and mRNA export factor ENY2 n=1 Tax=Asterionellopsis glacialis TaxID=33640 RepID=A0A7S0KXV9_9STRA|mmetsp:Transcript_35/g.45  ORF Transcript_35/g.45 Transcript_35/m.45 type:complete len:116 (+) Transcript_35:94-441(+)
MNTTQRPHSVNNSSNSSQRIDQGRDEFVKHLQETGEMDQLKQHLTAKLVDCGWFDDMKEVAQDVVRDRGGVTNITVDELVAELVSRGKKSVPSQVKFDMSTQLKDLLEKKPHDEL